MRSRCRTLVALGTCATHGGIPAMRNQWPIGATMDRVLGSSANGGLEAATMTASLDRVYAIDERVQVDVLVPGCPPRPETIVSVIEALVTGKPVSLPDKSVCETCPTIRSGKGRRVPLRFLANADYDPAEPVDQMRCLFEQGLLCMGPVTAGGCGGKETPLCLRARVPCRGCYGPVRTEGNPLMDMLNALASNGMDHRAVVDRKSLLRFSGAHGLLKPLKPKK
jgi:F420-non-reducing hydrogenase small subunit